jgi:hypothetical protein
LKETFTVEMRSPAEPVTPLDHAKAIGGTLVIAKLDRRARNVAFVANLTESGAEFVAASPERRVAAAFQLGLGAATWPLMWRTVRFLLPMDD